MHTSEATSFAEGKKLQLQIADSVFIENEQGGIIVEQYPDSGYLVKDGRKIYVTISAYSAPKVPLPNLKYDDKRNVIAQLKSIGFKIGNIKYIPSNCTDCLEHIEIDSTMIEPGSKLDQGSKIDLVFGGGKSDQFSPVPVLIGMNLEEMSTAIKNAGLKIGSVIPDAEYSSEDSLLIRVYKQIPTHDQKDLLFLGSAMQVFLTTDDNKIPEITIDSLTSEVYNNQ